MGPQNQYAEAVSLWKLYHDSLPYGTSGKIPANFQGIVLKSQLFGRARDFSRTMPLSVLVSKDGSQAIVDSVYKRVGLFIMNDIYKLSNELMTTKRGDNEPFDNYESRLAANLSRFNSYEFSARLCERCPHSCC